MDNSLSRPGELALDQVLSALSHGVRRSIVDQLRHGAQSAGELAEPYSMSLPAISRHLRILEEARLVTRRIEGRVHRLELVVDTLRTVDDWLSHYRTFWEGSLGSLARYLEDEGTRARTTSTRRARSRRPK